MPKTTRRDHRARWATLSLACLVLASGCAGGKPGASDGGADTRSWPDARGFGDAAAAVPDGAQSGSCGPGGGGLACLFAQFDELDDASADCQPEQLARFRASLERRHGELPAWYEGRALFISFDRPVAIASSFNSWSTTALVTEPLCDSNVYVADTAIASGRHPYKLVVDGAWTLDPENWAFVYDSFASNVDGANSVLNTYDSGLGHLVHPDLELCSTELDNCRRFYTYLPAGYAAPSSAGTEYPALFMHDGQNIFDDSDCCFGHTGWEINVTLDAEIAAGTMEPVVVVGLPHGDASRGAEYAYSIEAGGLQETFMAFQTTVVQPRAGQLWRLDADRYYLAGSSFGGLIAFRLAFAYPDLYAGAASLSGAYWVGKDDGTAMSAFVAQAGFIAMPLYLDHGGSAQSGADNYPDNVALRDQLAAAGWSRSDSPACNVAPNALCYYYDAGASHDELAWRDRNHHFLRFFFGL